jgi:hypothetical protein
LSRSSWLARGCSGLSALLPGTCRGSGLSTLLAGGRILRLIAIPRLCKSERCYSQDRAYHGYSLHAFSFDRDIRS